MMPRDNFGPPLLPLAPPAAFCRILRLLKRGTVMKVRFLIFFGALLLPLAMLHGADKDADTDTDGQ